MSGKNLVLLELSDLTGYGTATDRFAMGYRWFNVRRLSSFLQKFSIFFSDFFAKSLSIISAIKRCLVPFCEICRLAQIRPKLGPNGPKLGPNGPTWAKIDQNCAQIYQNGSKFVPIDPNWTL